MNDTPTLSNTPRTYMAAAQSFDRLMQESEQLERELAQAQDELAKIKTTLADPVAVRVNILRGTIKAPDDFYFEHDTNGPLAKARAEVEALRAQMTPEVGERQPDRPGDPTDFAGALRRMRDAESEVERLREDWKIIEDHAATTIVYLDAHGVSRITIDNAVSWHDTFKDAVNAARKEQP